MDVEVLLQSLRQAGLMGHKTSPRDDSVYVQSPNMHTSQNFLNLIKQMNSTMMASPHYHHCHAAKTLGPDHHYFVCCRCRCVFSFTVISEGQPLESLVEAHPTHHWHLTQEGSDLTLKCCTCGRIMMLCVMMHAGLARELIGMEKSLQYRDLEFEEFLKLTHLLLGNALQGKNMEKPILLSAPRLQRAIVGVDRGVEFLTACGFVHSKMQQTLNIPLAGGEIPEETRNLFEVGYALVGFQLESLQTKTEVQGALNMGMNIAVMEEQTIRNLVGDSLKDCEAIRQMHGEAPHDCEAACKLLGVDPFDSDAAIIQSVLCIIKDQSYLESACAALEAFARWRKTPILQQAVQSIKPSAVKFAAARKAASSLSVETTTPADSVIQGYLVAVASAATEADVAFYRQCVKTIAEFRNDTALHTFLSGEGAGSVTALPTGSPSSASPTPSSPSSHRSRPHQLVCGLENLHNVCYFNSLLQNYYMLSAFREAVYLYEPQDETSKFHPFMIELQKLFVYMQLSSDATFSAMHLLRSMVGVDQTFTGTQQDVHDFNGRFLDNVESAFKNATSSRCLEIFRELFCFTQRQYIRNPTTRELTYQDLDYTGSLIVHLNTVNDLYEALEQETGETTLETGQTQRIVFKTLPKVFMMHLAVVSYNTQTRTAHKEHTVFNMEPKLYLDRFTDEMLSEADAERDRREQLSHAIVQNNQQLHSLKDFQGGHSVASVMRAAVMCLNSNELLDAEQTQATIQSLEKAAASSTEQVQELERQNKQYNEYLNSVFEDAAFKRKSFHVHSVVIHDGGVESGHYWTNVFVPSESKWYKLNDTQVKVVPDREVWHEATGRLLPFAGFNTNTCASLISFMDTSDPLTTPSRAYPDVPDRLRSLFDLNQS